MPWRCFFSLRLDWRSDAGYAGRPEGSPVSAPSVCLTVLLLTHTLARAITATTQSQRDLYIAMRDLFVRHDRLSVDQVERLKKRVDANALKLENVKAVAKEGWEEEADKIAGTIEKDKVTISAQLSRRVFIRAW
jgi:hypothetical protein